MVRRIGGNAPPRAVMYPYVGGADVRITRENKTFAPLNDSVSILFWCLPRRSPNLAPKFFKHSTKLSQIQFSNNYYVSENNHAQAQPPNCFC